MSYRNDRYAAVASLTSPTTLRAGIVHPYDTGGGAIVQPLPDAATFGPSEGFYVMLFAGDNELTISPDAGDTINGSTDPVILTTAGDALFLIRDIIPTNWLIISRASAASARWTPVVPLASPYAADFGELVLLPSAPWTVELPPSATPDEGLSVLVKMDAADNDLVTISPSGGDTIDGAASFTFGEARGAVTLVLAGTDWKVT